MLEGREDLVAFVLSIPEELASFKGNKEKLLMKPNTTIGVEINGMYYPDLRALQILEDEVIIFHSPNMVQVKFDHVDQIDFR